MPECNFPDCRKPVTHERSATTVRLTCNVNSLHIPPDGAHEGDGCQDVHTAYGPCKGILENRSLASVVYFCDKHAPTDAVPLTSPS